MRFIHALSMPPNVYDWLAATHHPRILHVFDRACNLINERREVLSIVAPQIGNGPFNLVVDAKAAFLQYLNIESSISMIGDQLTLDDLDINIQTARLWTPCPDWERLHSHRHGIIVQLTKSSITNYLHLSGLPISQFQLSTLSTAIAEADLPAAGTAAKSLAGLGMGLTPAGDDVLMGAIYAAWILHSPDVASRLAQEIAETAVPLTTSLSAACLKSAGRGEAGEIWHEFLAALYSGNPSAVQFQLTRLLSVGHTSGADVLAGFFGTMMAGAKFTHPKAH